MNPTSCARLRRAAAALLVTATAGCAGARGGSPAAAPAPAPAAAVTPAPTSAAAPAPSVRGGYGWTAADVRFIRMMIGHHAQAIEMSHLAPSHGASAPVQELAARIVNAQHDEIALMRQWLQERGQPAPLPDTLTLAGGAHDAAGMSHDGMAGMSHGDPRDHGGTPSTAPGTAPVPAAPTATHATMPGMLTPTQMRALDAARGEEFDRLFLSGMIHHHQGAVAMVKELLATPGGAQDPSVFRIASDVNVDQTTEIQRMQQMLAALLFGRTAP